MKDKHRDESLDRRGFLRAGLGAGTVAAGSVGVVVNTAQAAENDQEKKKARYKETDHVKAYYRTNRY